MKILVDPLFFPFFFLFFDFISSLRCSSHNSSSCFAADIEQSSRAVFLPIRKSFQLYTRTFDKYRASTYANSRYRYIDRYMDTPGP